MATSVERVRRDHDSPESITCAKTICLQRLEEIAYCNATQKRTHGEGGAAAISGATRRMHISFSDDIAGNVIGDLDDGLEHDGQAICTVHLRPPGWFHPVEEPALLVHGLLCTDCKLIEIFEPTTGFQAQCIEDVEENSCTKNGMQRDTAIGLLETSQTSDELVFYRYRHCQSCVGKERPNGTQETWYFCFE